MLSQASGRWRGQRTPPGRKAASRELKKFDFFGILWVVFLDFYLVYCIASKAKPAARQGQKVANPERIRSRKAGLPKATAVKVAGGGAAFLLHPITHKSKFANQINIVHDHNYA